MKIDKRKGLNEFYLACTNQSDRDRWLTKLENSNWLFHIKEALATACMVAQIIDCEG